LLHAFPWAEGLYARPSGRDLVVGRPEWLGPRGEAENDDRLRLKGLGEGCYLIQARLHTGRYEDTGLAGDLEEVVNHLAGPLRHYMGVWTKPPPKKGRRTSGS
jgi:hypothetical protein